jgi:raffinose/stachyose/melibiose transport system substrate-binding protein
MKRSKLFVVAAIAAVALLGSAALAAQDATVKVLNGKVEIVDALKKMEVAYAKENPGKSVKFETVGGGADYAGTLMAKFQSGDAPDIFSCGGYSDLVDRWLEKAADLSDQPWVKDINPGAEKPMTYQGKLYGLPLAVEGFGFAYNKDLFAKAGIKTLPNTQVSLEAACKQLQAAGIQPFSNSYAEWWALGLHNINVFMAHQPDGQKWVADIVAGKTTTKATKWSKGWTDLLELTVKYGQKNPTTTGDYTSAVAAFAAGKAAMIQQGNWIQPDLDKVNPKLNVGFLPMPLSNDADGKISVGVPNFWTVNKNSPNAKAAKEFLNWMVSSETGRTLMTEEMKAVPAFKSIKAKSIRPLNGSLVEYASAGNTYSWDFNFLPPGSPELIGAAMMKFLAKQISADQLYAEIDKAIIARANAGKK